MSSEHDSIAIAVGAALNCGRFFVAPPARLRVEFAASQRVPWEIFRGHLIDPAHTRRSIVADQWSVCVDDDTPWPLINVLHEAKTARIYVTRQILVYAHEAYEESPGVIMTCAVQKWARELVATIDLGGIAPQPLAEALLRAVFLAVVGVSRLPITSLESPLPAYSLGQLGYCAALSPSASLRTDPIDYLTAALAAGPWRIEQAKALETCLRAISTENIAGVADVFVKCVSQEASSLPRLFVLFREMFNGVALAPYTSFTRRLTGLLDELATRDTKFSEPVTDALSYMLRHLCRHLTAFDLAVFHNYGANYPDALFLDELLRSLVARITRQPLLIDAAEGDAPAVARRKRMRRRALRQGALVRKHYEGLPVPDAPTSMGENQRVLPPMIPRVPEQQITELRTRRKQLFTGEPTEGLLDDTARRLLDESLADLAVSDELLELGLAVFLARPLGVFKEAGEVDRTPLVAYEAFSRAIAGRRLRELRSFGWLAEQEEATISKRLAELQPRGVPVAKLTVSDRPGVVSLADAAKASPDFMLLRSTASSLRELFDSYEWSPLAAASPDVAAWVMSDATKLLVPGESSAAGRATLRLLDAQGLCRVTLGLTRSPGVEPYRETVSGELLKQMQVLAVGEVDASGDHVERDFRRADVWLKLR